MRFWSSFGASAVLACSLGVAGCSWTLPLTATGPEDEDVTGSIAGAATTGVSPLSPQLGEEDWRRAQGALALALDPQGNGAPVNWDNPETKIRGAFAAAGPVFLIKDQVCRSFVATLGGKALPSRQEGQACREGPGEWTIRSLKRAGIAAVPASQPLPLGAPKTR